MQKGDFKSEVFGDVYSRQIYIGEQDSNKKLLTRQEIEALITKVSFENDSKLKSLAQCASDLIELANWRSRIIDVCVNWYSAIGNLLKSSQESVTDIQKVSNSINSATYANIGNSTYSTYLADAGAISSYVENQIVYVTREQYNNLLSTSSATAVDGSAITYCSNKIYIVEEPILAQSTINDSVATGSLSNEPATINTIWNTFQTVNSGVNAAIAAASGATYYLNASSNQINLFSPKTGIVSSVLHLAASGSITITTDATSNTVTFSVASINSATYANIGNSTYSTYLADAGAISSYVENQIVYVTREQYNNLLSTSSATAVDGSAITYCSNKIYIVEEPILAQSTINDSVATGSLSNEPATINTIWNTFQTVNSGVNAAIAAASGATYYLNASSNQINLFSPKTGIVSSVLHLAASGSITITTDATSNTVTFGATDNNTTYRLTSSSNGAAASFTASSFYLVGSDGAYQQITINDIASASTAASVGGWNTTSFNTLSGKVNSNTNNISTLSSSVQAIQTNLDNACSAISSAVTASSIVYVTREQYNNLLSTSSATAVDGSAITYCSNKIYIVEEPILAQSTINDSVATGSLSNEPATINTIWNTFQTVNSGVNAAIAAASGATYYLNASSNQINLFSPKTGIVSSVLHLAASGSITITTDATSNTVTFGATDNNTTYRLTSSSNGAAASFTASSFYLVGSDGAYQQITINDIASASTAASVGGWNTTSFNTLSGKVNSNTNNISTLSSSVQAIQTNLDNACSAISSAVTASSNLSAGTTSLVTGSAVYNFVAGKISNAYKYYVPTICSNYLIFNLSSENISSTVNSNFGFTAEGIDNTVVSTNTTNPVTGAAVYAYANDGIVCASHAYSIADQARTTATSAYTAAITNTISIGSVSLISNSTYSDYLVKAGAINAIFTYCSTTSTLTISF